MSRPVLIVDDNPTNLKLARVLLQSEGYPVLVANDANDAIEVLDKSDVGAILMDIQLPGIDGLELTRMLKRAPRFQHIPIIAVTAYAMYGDANIAIAAGCDAYITKPIDFDLLVSTLASLLTPPVR